MTKIEQRRSGGIWVINSEPTNLYRQEELDYETLVRDLTQIITPEIYNIMSCPISSLHACFLAVAAWRDGLQGLFPEYQFKGMHLKFNRKVKNVSGKEESGQIALNISKPTYATSIMMDVAGYIFGFSYPEMPIAIGTPEAISRIASQLYSIKLNIPSLRLNFNTSY